ncbi:nucleotide-binding universal stress UspA family protein [Conyzicola nivalis]|uniref:Nucleotide-binding universal stress UspA family protein n=1 Tax=Conyzicola nivalis TaxID=1477021 RepID=A0ABV2QQ45_9MICO
MRGSIVVGTDGSTPARSALLWAGARAVAMRSTLTLVHVSSRGESGSVGDDARADPLRTGIRTLRAVYPALDILTELSLGEPFAGLAEASREADLLVIGTHKTGFIQGRAIGSRYLDLPSVVAVPVAVIPSVPLTSRRGVVVGVDDSVTGRRAVEIAADTAESAAERLTLVLPSESRVFAEATDRVRLGHPLLHVSARVARHGVVRDLIDSAMVATLVVLPYPAAAESVGSEGAAGVRDLLLNLAGPAMVIPRSGPESCR